ESLILACDVGGTNTSVALVGRIGIRFDILHQARYRSQDLTSLEEALSRYIAEIADKFSGHKPDRISISGAGPVTNNICRLTNVSWTIDGNSIGIDFGIPTRVINDFSAISYGLPLLDVDDPEQITPVPGPGGYRPGQRGSVQAVVGAGTGLGIGYLVESGGKYTAFPSEGGHASFAPYDEVSRDLFEYIGEYIGDGQGIVPGSELFVSGQGITWTYRFFYDSGRIPPESTVHPELLGIVDWLQTITPGLRDEGGGSHNEIDIAAAVSRAAAAGDAAAGDIMRRFVRNYARVASDAALHFLPAKGLFLAGGIAAKNEQWFLQEDLFAEFFVQNYRDHIGALLRDIPVYIVKDYAISLYGAAHGAYALEERLL
ncbi:MAG: glucokinase, partial [Alkalispirochaeta sp.]